MRKDKNTTASGSVLSLSTNPTIYMGKIGSTNMQYQLQQIQSRRQIKALDKLIAEDNCMAQERRSDWQTPVGEGIMYKRER